MKKYLQLIHLFSSINFYVIAHSSAARLLILLITISAAKLHAQNAPAIEWDNCLGGSNHDVGICVKQTYDGGYITCGYSDSNDGDVTLNHGNNDFWVVRLDASSNIFCQKCL